MVKHKLVPVEPTLDMIDAGIDATTVDITEKTAAWIYEAMIAAAPAAQGEPVAWMHSDPDRVDVIHDKVRKLLKDSSDNAGYLHRPLDKSERYTIPLYTAPQPAPEVVKLVEALEEISDPIRFMRERLEEGEQLNGMAAVQLAKDAEYLRSIAKAALAAYHKGDES